MTLTYSMHLCGLLCTILFAWFTMREASQNKNLKAETKSWYGNIWRKIEKLTLEEIASKLNQVVFKFTQ